MRKTSQILASAGMAFVTRSLQSQTVRHLARFVPMLQKRRGPPVYQACVRNFSTQLQANSVAGVNVHNEVVQVHFADGEAGDYPFLWLRDNCQCDSCFHKTAQGRLFLMDDLKTDVHPTRIKEMEHGILVNWSDEHQSEYQSEWLQKRSFSPSARKKYRSVFALGKVPWGADHSLDNFDYPTLMSDDKYLLDYLVVMEQKGAALVQNTPIRDTAGCELMDHIGFVKRTHYGLHSPVINRPGTNNVAYSNAKLGLHNDLAQYEYMAGVIFIQCLKQHLGKGGDSKASDGLYAAEYLRRVHPEAFDILSSTDCYFWDQGTANIKGEESDEFYKVSRGPILRLNNEREVVRVSVNNQVRDSFLDLPADKVTPLYKAMKLFNNILNENAIVFKMEAGDMLSLDNIRCLHGREKYEASSDRHIESSYIDWDEMRCRRRRLQEAESLRVSTSPPSVSRA